MTALRSLTYVSLALLACLCQRTSILETTAMAADNSSEPKKSATAPTAAKTETATFGEGCFWCSEAVFQRLKGVKSVVSGYSGGAVDKPTYEQVCTGRTGHAEVIQVTFDPSVFNAVESYGTVGLVQNTWRELNPKDF